MNQPEQQQIDHWLAHGREGIVGRRRRYKEGFYEKEEISIQSMYTGLALSHATLASAKFLNGDPIDEVRAEFANAARCVLKSFTMAYDESDPDYLGDQWPARNPHYTGHRDSPVTARYLNPVHGQVDWSCVTETDFIEGINYALMATDFPLAETLSTWFQDSPDGELMDIDVNRYAHALKHVILGSRQHAWGLLKAQLDDYEKTPPKSAGDKNYYTLITTLFGIVEKDLDKFNAGLAAQLKFYESHTRGEGKDTTEEFICDHAVALANLGLHHGLKVTVDHDTFPKGLLIQT